MAEENKNVETTEGQGNEEQNEQTQPEKKYTDEEVNNISVKNSKKAVAKLMKELGITEKTDRAKVKELIEKAQLDKQEEPETDGAEQNSRVAAELAEARAMAEGAVLEALMLAAHVKADKVSKAVKLIDRADCLDDDGKFSREKASAAVTELLKTWTELTDKAEDRGPGFTIGGDGQAVKALPEETAAGLPPKVLILTTDKPWEKRLSEAYMKVLNLSGVQYEVFTVTMDNLQDLQDKCRPELSQEERYKFNRMAATADSERARKQVHEAQRAHAAVAAPPYHSVLLALDARDAGLVRSRLPLRTSVWATSTTNPGDPKTSSSASALAFDLNHVVFAECPFILRYDNESFEAKFQTALPYSMPAKRLFALGLDAYQVAEDWAHGRKAFEISGETGQLTVHRDLSAQVVRTPASFEIRSGELVDTAVDSEVPDETAAEGEVEPNMGAPEPIEPEVLQEDDTTQNSNI